MILRSEDQTARAGVALAKMARRGDVITLCGPLGVGKTALARGFIAALGHDGEVPSPTFAIVQPYEDVDPPVIEKLDVDASPVMSIAVSAFIQRA